MSCRAVPQDGVTDKREQIKAAVERMRAEDKMLMSMLTFDESCELAEAALGPLPAEKARWVKWAKQLSDRTDRAEADANRLAEALRLARGIFMKDRTGLIADEIDAALAEHDKDKSND